MENRLRVRRAHDIPRSRPQRDYLREQGRCTRRKRRALEELPDTRERSRVRRDNMYDPGGQRLVQWGMQKVGGEQGRLAHQRLSVFRLVELILEPRAGVGLAVIVLMRRRIFMLTTRQESQARN